MAGSFQPPPTYAEILIINKNLKEDDPGKYRFNPIWLKWFLDVAAAFSAAGSGGGGGADHNLLSNLQGGTANQYYHITAAQDALFAGGTSGTGALTRVTSPTFVTPILGAALATSINFGGATLNAYEDGAWTPSDTSGASLSLTLGTCRYLKVGKLVAAEFDITWPITASGAGVQIGGLPFTSAADGNVWPIAISLGALGTTFTGQVLNSSKNFTFDDVSGVQKTNVQFSASHVTGAAIYRAST
jgi:hypothetical protein